jgi:MFS family permease
VGVTNFGMSVIALYIVNSYGRRRLLFIGICGQVLGMGVAAGPLLAPGNVSSAGGWTMVAGILFFVLNFAYSSGPLAWVVISEVYPLGARGKGAGIATACNWLANYIVALVYPIAIGSNKGREQQRRVGQSFVAFGAICLFTVWYVWQFVPETHQKSLEAIEEEFEARRLKRKHASANGAAKLKSGPPAELGGATQ